MPNEPSRLSSGALLLPLAAVSLTLAIMSRRLLLRIRDILALVALLKAPNRAELEMELEFVPSASLLPPVCRSLLLLKLMAASILWLFMASVTDLVGIVVG